MRITISNNAQLPNKYLRFIKWKINSMKRKFQELIYVEIFLNSEGQSPKTFIVNIRLGIAGNDIIIQNKSENLVELFQNSTQSIHRYLAKNKSIINKSAKRNEIFYKKTS
jgi:ribosome-associated translation inhibitor RaiA